MSRNRKNHTAVLEPVAGDPRPVVVEGGSIRVEARVLCDFNQDGKPVKAGTLFVGDDAVVAQLAKDGLVDPHPDAVAYVKAQSKG